MSETGSVGLMHRATDLSAEIDRSTQVCASLRSSSVIVIASAFIRDVIFLRWCVREVVLSLASV